MSREICRGPGNSWSSDQLSTSSTKAEGSREGWLCRDVMFARRAGDKVCGTEEQ